jgi:hypothetical protein
MRRALAAAGAALLLAGTFGTLAAEGEEDFAASKGSAAEAQLEARLKSAVRTIPGTDTQYFIGGYVQLDAQATRSQQVGDEQDTFFVSATPFGAADSDARLSVRQSQFNWVSRTPTGIGEVGTRLEVNLFPLDGTTALTLNQLYVKVADWLLAGKTYSTFMDDGALPTTADYNGPSGVTFVRQWLVRGSLPLGKGWALEGAVEESQADFAAGGAALALQTSASRPDLAARVRYEGDGSHFQLAGLQRRIGVTVTGPAGTVERDVDGSGVSVSGSLAAFGEDTLLLQAVSGKGVGRYFNDPLSATGVALGANGQLDLVRSTGVTLYYQHQWAPDWMSVAGASTLAMSDEDVRRRPEELKRVVYASVNLLRRLKPQLIVGGELLLGEATRVDGATATNARLQFSARYLVF